MIDIKDYIPNPNNISWNKNDSECCRWKGIGGTNQEVKDYFGTDNIDGFIYSIYGILTEDTLYCDGPQSMLMFLKEHGKDLEDDWYNNVDIVRPYDDAQYQFKVDEILQFKADLDAWYEVPSDERPNRNEMNIGKHNVYNPELIDDGF